MPDLSNAAIADALEELGDLYELDGAIVHRVLAYRTAARAVRETAVSVAGLARAGRATDLAGIGKTLQEKILALLDTGAIPAAERLRAQFPPGLLALTRLPGLGPKRARLLYEELGIDSLQALREAALAQRLRSVKRLGPKFEASVLAALEALPTDAQGDDLGTGNAPTRTRRLLLPAALELGAELARGPAGERTARRPGADRGFGTARCGEREGRGPCRGDLRATGAGGVARAPGADRSGVL